MNLLWDLYWPVLVLAIVLGINAGAVAFRKRPPNKSTRTKWRRRRVLILSCGIALALAGGALWHGPAGKSARFASEIERQTRTVLVDFEMDPVRAAVARDPISRTLVLSGPADDFQRSELVRILDEVPGVANVRWVGQPAGFSLTLLAEVELAALVSFGLGLVLAYLLELRRRSNAQWRW